MCIQLEKEHAVEATGPELSQSATTRDPLYLFACHLEWRFSRNLKAYEELIAALDDTDGAVRTVAEHLLHRSSPRPR